MNGPPSALGCQSGALHRLERPNAQRVSLFLLVVSLLTVFAIGCNEAERTEKETNFSETPVTEATPQAVPQAALPAGAATAPAPTKAAPTLTELPFRFINVPGEHELPIERRRTDEYLWVGVKVPLSDYLLETNESVRRQREEAEMAILTRRQPVPFEVLRTRALAQLQMGGVCVYDNPDLPAENAGISWLDTSAEPLPDGTAVVNLGVFIRTATDRNEPQVAVTRVRCVSAKTFDISSLVSAADKLPLTGSDRIRGFNFDQMLKEELPFERARFVRAVIPGSTYKTGVTEDKADAFTGKRRVTVKTELPGDRVQDFACEAFIGPAVFRTTSLFMGMMQETYEVPVANTAPLGEKSGCVVTRSWASQK